MWVKKYRLKYLGYGLGIVAGIYLVLGVILAVQISNVLSSARHVQSTTRASDPKVFSESYRNFSHRLNSLSVVAANPIWQPIFFLAGTPSTYSHEAKILRSSSAIVKSLSPIFDAPDAMSPGLLTNMELI